MTNVVNYPVLCDEFNFLKLEILAAALYSGDRSWNYPNTVSPFNRIYFIVSGDAYVENEHKRWTLQPGYMYLIPAESRYTYVCTGEIHKFYFHFNLALFPGIDLFSRFGEIQEIPYTAELLNEILANAKENSISGLLNLKAIVWQVVCDFFRRGTDHSDYLELFSGFYRQAHVLHYLSDNLSAALRIQDIAHVLHTPVHRLSRSFRHDTGRSLKEYIEQLLMQKARHLLLNTQLPICQIAELLGFSDPFYFSRFFKKNEQLSPKDYRKQRL